MTFIRLINRTLRRRRALQPLLPPSRRPTLPQTSMGQLRRRAMIG